MAKYRHSWGIICSLVMLGGLLTDGTARGQNAPAGQTANDQSAQGAANGGELQEIVVTATHFTTALNQTPLSIIAVTTENLNQEGINTFADLAKTVPSISINSTNGVGIATIAIRGIFQNGPGAATTGLYLDDTPLQSFNNHIATSSLSGTPLPPIFDLQRVEVLEGPQGTLFGASSEGGTIRYITPTPDLRNYHVYAKLDGGYTDRGDGGNYAAGLAVGGPIIDGVLGFRASIYTSQTAGFLQMEDPLTRQVFQKGLNSENVQEFNGKLLWEPTANFSVEGGFFSSETTTPYGGTSYTQSLPYQIQEPELGFNTTGITPAHYKNPSPVCVGAAACAAYNGTITYLRPGTNYGPFNLPRDTVLGMESQAYDQAALQGVNIPSLNLTWELPSITIQLFNSLLITNGIDNAGDGIQLSTAAADATVGPYEAFNDVPFSSLDPEQGVANEVNNDYRRLWAEDLRFSSTQGPTQRGSGLLSWTAGLYYQDEYSHEYHVEELQPGTGDTLSEALFGISYADRYGSEPCYDSCLYNFFSLFQEHEDDTNTAVYAQANYNVTNAGQLTVGLRESHLTNGDNQVYYGPVQNIAVPTIANGGLSFISATENAFTPLIEYAERFSDTKLVYLLADKGFRPGGANTPEPASLCIPALAIYGLPLSALPKAYGPDSNWNYELGTKLEMANRLQLNGDVFRDDWSNVQTSQSPGGNCGKKFTTNAAHAISMGVELSAQAIATKWLTLDGSFGYDHAYYTENAVPLAGAPGFPSVVVALKGQNFALPPWTANLGARLDIARAFNMRGSVDPYLRADWSDSANYLQNEYPNSGYTPLGNAVPAVSLLNARAGVTVGAFDLNVYAINALDTTAASIAGGRASCKNPACTSYATYNPIITLAPLEQPRTVGLQFTYTK